jgi:hypothetical protein
MDEPRKTDIGGRHQHQHKDRRIEETLPKDGGSEEWQQARARDEEEDQEQEQVK